MRKNYALYWFRLFLWLAMLYPVFVLFMFLLADPLGDFLDTLFINKPISHFAFINREFGVFSSKYPGNGELFLLFRIFDFTFSICLGLTMIRIIYGLIVIKFLDNIFVRMFSYNKTVKHIFTIAQLFVLSIILFGWGLFLMTNINLQMKVDTLVSLSNYSAKFYLILQLCCISVSLWFLSDLFIRIVWLIFRRNLVGLLVGFSGVTVTRPYLTN